MDRLIHRQPTIGEFSLFREIIIQCGPQLRGTAVQHGSTVKDPFLLRDIVIADPPGMGIDTGEQLSVNGDILIRRKAECLLGKNAYFSLRSSG